MKVLKTLLMMVAIAGVVLTGCAKTSSSPTSPHTNAFTGTFTREYMSVTQSGATVHHTITFSLEQQNTSLTGTRSSTGIHPSCTASYTVPVTGIINGMSAVIEWAPSEHRCDGLNGSWYRISTKGGTFPVTLVDNGAILRFDRSGNEYHCQ